MDVHAHDRYEKPPARSGKKLAEKCELGKAETHGGIVLARILDGLKPVRCVATKAGLIQSFRLEGGEVRRWLRTVGRLRIGVGAALLLAAVLLAVFYRELPAWRFGGTSSRAAIPIGFDAPGSLCPPGWQKIDLRGDSLVAGLRMGSSSGAGKPYGVVMAQAFGGGVTVRLRGRGGATAADGEALWRETAVDGEILLLAYGTNDAAVRGRIGEKTPVPMQFFRESMLRQIRQARSGGANVGLIVPPPAGSPAMMDRLRPYRLEVQRIGREEGIPVFDPAEAFAECRSEEPLLTSDALHLNRAGHDCLGRWLARNLCN